MANAKAGLILDAIDRTATAFNSVDARVKGLQRVAGVATRAFGFLAAGIGAREITEAADRYKILENRLRLVTDSSEELEDVQSRLFQLAQASRSSLEGTVELYARIARSSTELGISQARLLNVTQSVNQAIQIAGGTAQEAQAGVIQFAQGLASGALRGDELRSVLEGMPRLAQALAAGMGTTIGRLRELGSEGELTAARVIGAIENQASTLQSEFGQLDSTVGQSVTQLGNSMLNLVGHIDEATGASSSLAKAIRGVSKAIDELTDADSAAAGVLEGAVKFTREGISTSLPFAAAIRVVVAALSDEKDATATLNEELARLAEANQTLSANFVGPTQKMLQESLAAIDTGNLPGQRSVDELMKSTNSIRLEQLDGLIEFETDYANRRIEVWKSAEIQLTEVLTAEEEKRRRFRELSAKQQTQYVLGELIQMTAGVAQHSKAMFKLNQFAAIANAIINTAQGVTQALAAYPPPLSFAMAAAVAAAGYAQVQAIRSTTFQGGGGGTTPSAAGQGSVVNSQPTQALAAPTQDLARSGARIEIKIEGATFVGPGGIDDLMDVITDGLSDRLENNDQLIFSRTSRQASEVPV